METDSNLINSNDLGGKKFSIENDSFIYELLRNKLYQDPILAICREIACNARDAHRNAGKAEVPIKITVPNYSNNVFEVTDMGHGISPEIVENIFTKYAASTKRNDENQTGGFGLGAKTPFAYCNSFSLITVYNGIRYQYLCYIDESKVGAMALIDQHETTDPSGTTVSIKVEQKDIRNFIQKAIEATTYWDVRPNINATYPSAQDKIISSEYFFFEHKNIYAQNNMFAIIDGIKYPIDISKLYFDRLNFNYTTYLLFKNGEVSLNPNRETIHYDEKSIQIIKERIELSINQFSEYFQNKINNCKSLKEAVVVKHDYKSFTNQSSDFTYKGFRVPERVDVYRQDCFKLSKKEKTGRFECKFTSFFSIDDVIYLNDLGCDSNKLLSVKSKIVKNLSKNSVIFIKYTDKDVTDYNPEVFDVRKLSSILSEKDINKKPAKKKQIFYKYNKDTNEFVCVPQKQVYDDESIKLLVSMNKNKYTKYSNGYLKGFIGDMSLYSLIDVSDEEIEGMSDDFISLNDYLEMKFSELKNEMKTYLNDKNFQKNYQKNLSSLKLNYNIAVMIKQFLKTDCEYIDRICGENSPSFKNDPFMESLIHFYLEAGNSIELDEVKKETAQNKLEVDFYNKYSLLRHFNLSLDYYFNLEQAEEIAKYIDLINNSIL